jgi:hypothetical protein
MFHECIQKSFHKKITGVMNIYKLYFNLYICMYIIWLYNTILYSILFSIYLVYV